MISTARQNYIQRIAALKYAMEDEIVQDQPPTNVRHNERARFLRNGLAIISFNILEDFIKNRIAEILQQVSTSSVAFSRLPARLQEATLLDPLTGIDKVAKLMKRSGLDWKTFVQDQSRILMSSTISPYSLTGYGMGYQGSNLGEKEVAEFMGNFQVKGGWDSIERVTAAIGCTVVTAKQVFVNAANRRHTAAHDPNSHIPYTDIENFLTHGKAIAFAFDMLISKAAHNLRKSYAPYLAGVQILPADLQFRFVRKTPRGYLEMNITNISGLKNHPSENAAITSIQGRRNYNDEMLVVVEVPSKVENWYTLF